MMGTQIAILEILLNLQKFSIRPWVRGVTCPQKMLLTDRDTSYSPVKVCMRSPHKWMCVCLCLQSNGQPFRGVPVAWDPGQRTWRGCGNGACKTGPSTRFTLSHHRTPPRCWADWTPFGPRVCCWTSLSSQMDRLFRFSYIARCLLILSMSEHDG